MVVRGPINVTSVTTPPHIHQIWGITRKESTRRSEGSWLPINGEYKSCSSGQAAQTGLIELWHAHLLSCPPNPTTLLRRRCFDLFETFCSFGYGDNLLQTEKTSLVLLNENHWSLQTNKQGHKNRCLPEPKDTWSCEQTGDDVTNTAGPIETKRPS